MGVKALSLFLIITMLLSCFFVNVSSVNVNNAKITTSSIEEANLPEWSAGNFWKYDMNFIFTSHDGLINNFMIDARIEDLTAVVTSITDLYGELVYVLSLNGYITGTVSLILADISLADLRGPLSGTAIISKDTLGIKNFVFNIDAEAGAEVNLPVLGWKGLNFDMIMDFVPSFDFFAFPINITDENWDFLIEPASLEVEVGIPALGPLGESNFSSSMVFNDVMEVNRVETVFDVPAGIFDTFVLKGIWGDYDLSNLWYAPAAGYLVKVDEVLYWENGTIESEFYLKLIETNFNEGNSPPNKPDTPYGQNMAEINHDYIYMTKTIDPEGDQVEYLWDFGDGADNDWVGPYESGEIVTATNRWYTKGSYNVIVKSRDESGIESEWSEPFPVTVLGNPKITVSINHIEQIDDIDVGSEPELYYTVAAGSVTEPVTYYHTTDGTDQGNWISNDNWEPEMEHVFIADGKDVLVTIKLMDHDDFLWDGSWDPDLADVSGCDGDGVDNDVFPPEEVARGAIYHGTFNMATKLLKEYTTGEPNTNADYVFSENGEYLTCGHYQPDYSEGDDGNDAKVWFELDSDYIPPQANAQIIEPPEKLRSKEEIRFAGKVTEGAPSYSWSWDFDSDGVVDSTDPNPVYSYDEDGTYTAVLTVTDSYGEYSSNSLVLVIENDDPILSNDEVSWTGNGKLEDTFTFSVHYIDGDDDNPTVKKVFIDGNAKTLEGYGWNSDYILDLTGTAIGKGQHTYYFYFEDGHGSSAQTSEKTFSVEKSRSRYYNLNSILLILLDNFPLLEKFLKITIVL